MKRLIALLLLAPVLASAQGLQCTPFPGQKCGVLLSITTGTMSLTNNGGDPGGAAWSASGPGFTTDGGSAGIVNVGLSYPIPYSVGGWSSDSLDNSDSSFNMGLTVNGVSYGYVPQSQTFASAEFTFETSGPRPITHPGTYSASFDFSSNLNGQLSSVTGNCTDPSNPCTNWPVDGSGTGVIYVSDYPGVPGDFYVTGGSFTFGAFGTPEPSTASLLFLGFAGLVVLGRRRRPVANYLRAS